MVNRKKRWKRQKSTVSHQSQLSLTYLSDKGAYCFTVQWMSYYKWSYHKIVYYRNVTKLHKTYDDKASTAHHCKWSHHNNIVLIVYIIIASKETALFIQLFNTLYTFILVCTSSMLLMVLCINYIVSLKIKTAWIMTKRLQ